jgi:hypothetical protein
MSQLKYEDQPRLSEKAEERLKQFLDKHGLVHVEDIRIARAAFGAGWAERKLLTFAGEPDGPDYRSILISFCASIAINGHDVGDIAEDTLEVLKLAGFSQEEVEEHMNEDLLSFKWFDRRGIPTLWELERRKKEKA